MQPFNVENIAERLVDCDRLQVSTETMNLIKCRQVLDQVAGVVGDVVESQHAGSYEAVDTDMDAFMDRLLPLLDEVERRIGESVVRGLSDCGPNEPFFI